MKMLFCSVCVLFTVGVVYGQACPQAVSNDDHVAVLDLCETYTQAAARLYCAATYSSDLAIVTSKEQNKAMYDLRLALGGGGYNAWIGATDADEEDVFRWVDGTLVDYDNWFTGEPNDHGDGQDCTIMGSGSNKWDDQACDEEFRAFFCDGATGVTTTASPVTPSPVTTPSPVSGTPQPTSWNSGTWWNRN